jgi:hypothetical protein
MRPLPAIVRTEDEAKLLKDHVFMKARTVIVSPGAYTILEGVFKLAPKPKIRKGPASFSLGRGMRVVSPEEKNPPLLPPKLEVAIRWLMCGSKCQWDYKTMNSDFGFMPVARKRLTGMQSVLRPLPQWVTDHQPSAATLKMIHRRIWLMGLMGNRINRGGSLMKLPKQFWPSWVPSRHRASLRRIIQLVQVSQIGDVV